MIFLFFSSSLACLEPELELFEVWEINVRQIIIIANGINSQTPKLQRALTWVLDKLERNQKKENHLPQVLHRLQNKEKPIRTTFTLRFGSLKMIFECSIARCDVGLGRAIVQCQKNPLRKPKLSINRAILSAHFSAVKFCIGFFCWIGFFWFCIGFFCNWMLQLLLKIVAKNLNYASLHVCT